MSTDEPTANTRSPSPSQGISPPPRKSSLRIAGQYCIFHFYDVAKEAANAVSSETLLQEKRQRQSLLQGQEKENGKGDVKSQTSTPSRASTRSSDSSSSGHQARRTAPASTLFQRDDGGDDGDDDDQHSEEDEVQGVSLARHNNLLNNLPPMGQFVVEVARQKAKRRPRPMCARGCVFGPRPIPCARSEDDSFCEGATQQPDTEDGRKSAYPKTTAIREDDWESSVEQLEACSTTLSGVRFLVDLCGEDELVVVFE